MKVKQRQTNIVEYLLKQDDFVTVKSLSYMFSVSPRTIHSDLSIIEEEYILEKKRGVGIRIIDKLNDTKRGITIDKRRLEIMKMLLLNGKTVTYQSLANQFFISTSSLNNDFRWIDSLYIKPFGLQLVSGDGTRIIGKESDIQSALHYLNCENLYISDLTFSDINSLILFEQFYGEKLINVCWKSVLMLQDSQFETLPDYYLFNIFSSLIILIYRSNLGFHQKENVDNEFKTDMISDSMNYLLAKELIEEIKKEAEFKIALDDKDITCLSLILKANRINFLNSSKIVSPLARKFTQELVENMSRYLDCDLTHNLRLIDHLERHCDPLINRIKNNILIQNPMIDVIKQEYKTMFEIVWYAVQATSCEISGQISEDEVGFIMLYFQRELEQMKKIHKILVVCPNGMVASNLIVSDIKRYLPPLDVIEVSSIEKLKCNDLSGFDFIVSTVDLGKLSIPVIAVSNLLTENDISHIKSAYKNLDKQNINRRNMTRDIKLDPKLIWFELAPVSKNAVLKVMCKTMLENDLVKPGYYESVADREKLSPTDLVGAAIPHGHYKYVNKTSLGIFVCPKGIQWETYRVKIIILFALAEEDLPNVKEVLNDVMRLVDDEFLLGIGKLKSKDELLDYLKGGLND